MNEKSIPIIKTKITLVTKNNYKHAEKVLFSDDKNTQYVHNICCSWIKTDLRCNFIVMILTRTGLHTER